MVEVGVFDELVLAEALLGELSDLGKGDLVVSKGIDCHFVGGVEDGAGSMAGAGDLEAEPKGTETVKIGRLKVEAG